MTLIEGSTALPLFVSNVVTIMLIVFFGRDRYQQRNAFKHQLARLESKALIAQMNPHFIFNTLNRIPKHNGLKRRRRGEQIHRDFFGAIEKNARYVCNPKRTINGRN